jgi:hypothetical protein
MGMSTSDRNKPVQLPAQGESLKPVRGGADPVPNRQHPPGNERRQSGMDRVIEKTPWQQYRKPMIWGGVILLALAVFWYFKPDSGRALKVQNDRIVISTVTRGEFDDYIPVRGQVAPLKTVFLDAIEGGRVEAIHVEDGA